MATTTATITINSDIPSYGFNLNTQMTMNQAGTNIGLEQTTGLASRTFAGNTTQVVLVDVSAENITPSGANKVYIRNTGTDKTKHFKITLADATDDTEEIGRLYGGDWMLFPYLATDANEDIMIQPSSSDKMTVEYMVFHQ